MKNWRILSYIGLFICLLPHVLPILFNLKGINLREYLFFGVTGLSIAVFGEIKNKRGK